MINVGINGLGRIGRLTLRAALEDKNINLSFLNTPTDPESVCHLIKYDSIHGTFDKEISYSENSIIIEGKNIPLFSERNPAKLPLLKHNIDIMLECSGKFNNREEASKHLEAGAKKIIVSAPCANADKSIIMCVNEDELEPGDNVISIGSCTTNALAPIAKILDENLGIENGYMTTIHAFTGDQNLVDNSHKDLRRARAASYSMVPTKTGATKMIGEIIPNLKGKLSGSAVRVPVGNVSMIDLKCLLKKETTATQLNELIKDYANNSMINILATTRDPVVSVDMNHTIYSAILDENETYANNKFIRILAWYDNEWAFAKRMIDCTNLIQKYI